MTPVRVRPLRDPRAASAGGALLKREAKTRVPRTDIEDAARPALDRVCGQLVTHLGDLDHRHALIGHPIERGRPSNSPQLTSTWVGVTRTIAMLAFASLSGM